MSKFEDVVCVNELLERFRAGDYFSKKTKRLWWNLLSKEEKLAWIKKEKQLRKLSKRFGDIAGQRISDCILRAFHAI